MSRAERRRAQKCEQKSKTATYNLTRAQLDALVREKISGELDRVKREATNDAINQAMILLLTLPLEVLMDHYWPKSYAKRIPEFTEYVLKYYEKWQNDELDMDKLKEDLWVYGGVRLEEVEGKLNGIFNFRNYYSGSYSYFRWIYSSVRYKCCNVDGRFHEMGR